MDYIMGWLMGGLLGVWLGTLLYFHGIIPFCIGIFIMCTTACLSKWVFESRKNGD